MPEDITYNQSIIKYSDGHYIEQTDDIATEFPLTLYVNQQEFATIVCSPTNLHELVLGFLASEGVIFRRADIKDIHIDDSKGFCHIILNREIEQHYGQYTKRMISSCCGKSRQFYFVNDAATSKVSLTDKTVTAAEIFKMMNALQTESTDFKQTGGLHNAAISDGKDFYIHRSDIGRHNALDKLFGYCIEQRIPIRDKVLIFSGRISSEILIKASKIGVGIILSKSAPTDLAIKLASDLNITAVGFIRNESFNIYSHAERIK
ncbi:formate dehydrogenase accessory sulfurtransferase FdhD [Macrococcus hajekii]|uniref:Sulfur carrier protein FdhD n=1 Tax=Macrococcus hajekii TaxID=198482 RepID=A0A4R6BJM4_9STAP|nr:formate dehydrogenase accessory sulfurtransferase FdhD [Macrococcus hajekii]TDM01909.1 formate dehydrogenase accessory sulfurtransferase FdhD [Macrococcus hajekii]GGB08480.1 sulfurtransferase FdhD [Macrococcus hajekii]